MTDDLVELNERITYCSRQIDDLQVDVRAYLGENVELRPWRPFQSPDMLAQIRAKSPLPTGIRIRVGSIVNELRAVLDGFACVLAARNRNDANGVYFPISKDEAVFKVDGMRKIKKLSKPDQQTIAELKPWADGNPKLFAFHVLDTIRKHRRLALQVAAHAGTGLGAGPSGFGYVSSITMHSIGPLTGEWQTIATIAPGSHVDLGTDSHITFAEPDALRGLDVILGLSWFRDEVVSIVDKFC